MSNTDNIRWQQRLENFGKALRQLEAAAVQDEYSDLERAGMMQIFEFTFELAWKTLKDLLFAEGYNDNTPRSAIRRSFEVQYISEEDGATLLEALSKRNLLSHTYEEEVARTALKLIKEEYLPAIQRTFSALQSKLPQ